MYILYIIWDAWNQITCIYGFQWDYAVGKQDAEEKCFVTAKDWGVEGGASDSCSKYNIPLYQSTIINE